jgi:adenylosuccinate lyase
MKSLENNSSFYNSLLKDKKIMDKIPVNTLKKLFDFSYHTRKIDVIFKRILKK